MINYSKKTGEAAGSEKLSATALTAIILAVIIKADSINTVKINDYINRVISGNSNGKNLNLTTTKVENLFKINYHFSNPPQPFSY